MACTLQTDSDQWLALMGANPALRDCIADVFGIVDAEITEDALAEVNELLAQLEAYLGKLTVQLDVVVDQLVCVDLLISTLSGLPLIQQTPETNALLSDMSARKVVLDAQKIELQATLAPSALPAQIANTLALSEEMLCQKANAAFFNSLTG
jgi:hypothetical protein